jgi:hypothetical protein
LESGHTEPCSGTHCHGWQPEKLHAFGVAEQLKGGAVIGEPIETHALDRSHQAHSNGDSERFQPLSRSLPSEWQSD